jgi:hypothetical protein
MALWIAIRLHVPKLDVHLKDHDAYALPEDALRAKLNSYPWGHPIVH